MDDRGPLHAWRDGVARIADGLTRPRTRVRRMDPALAASSACHHEWLPSPIGPAEYCGRCGAIRRRHVDAGVADRAATTPTVIAGTVVGADAALPPPRPVGPPDAIPAQAGAAAAVPVKAGPIGRRKVGATAAGAATVGAAAAMSSTPSAGGAGGLAAASAMGATGPDGDVGEATSATAGHFNATETTIGPDGWDVVRDPAAVAAAAPVATPAEPASVPAAAAAAVPVAGAAAESLEGPAVTPRITRPAPVGEPVLVAAAPVGDQRSTLRTATMAAALLSVGVLIGFLSAGATRDVREGRGAVAVVPTSTPARPTQAPASAPATSAEPSPVAGPTAAASPSAGPVATPPPVAGPAMAAPLVTLGALTGSGMELGVTWQPPSDGTAVSRYDLGLSRGGGEYRPVDLARRDSRRATVAAAAGQDYSLRVRARGSDGTPGDWATTGLRLDRREESGDHVRASKGWKIAKYRDYTGAGARYSTTGGAELTLAFDGTGVAVVGPTGPERGRADVFVDGQRVGRFDALGSRFRPVQLLFRADGLNPGPHTLTVRVAGTSGRPMVAVDKFFVLSQSQP